MAWLSALKNRLSGLGYVVGSLAILFYMTVVVLSLLPNSTLRDRLYRPVYKYVAAFGLTQNYAVFAPHVPMNNTTLTAVVTLKDGNTAVWMFPRMEQLGLFERVPLERYRKWWHDSVLSRSSLCPDAARFVARQFDDPSNPPQMVALQSHSQPIPVPPDELESHRKAAKPEHKTIYVYRVTPEDLR